MKKVLMMLFIGIIVSSCLNEEEKKLCRKVVISCLQL